MTIPPRLTAPNGFPVARADAIGALRARADCTDAVIAVAPLRILAVDDEPALNTMVALMLEPAGHWVSAATSGEEALARFEGGEQFDLLISDIGMSPGMSGWDLVRAVRQRWPATRIVLATGWGAQINADVARGRGVERVISKPYRLLDMQGVVARVSAMVHPALAPLPAKTESTSTQPMPRSGRSNPLLLREARG